MSVKHLRGDAVVHCINKPEVQIWSKNTRSRVNGMYIGFKVMVKHVVTSETVQEKEEHSGQSPIFLCLLFLPLYSEDKPKENEEMCAASGPGTVTEWVVIPHHYVNCSLIQWRICLLNGFWSYNNLISWAFLVFVFILLFCILFPTHLSMENTRKS